MKFLIKLFGGFTKEELQKEKDKVTALEEDLQKVKKENDTLVKEVTKLQEEMKVVKAESNKEKEVYVPDPDSFYLKNSFEDMFITEGRGKSKVRYIDAYKLIDIANNSLNTVYNAIWGKDSDKKVTFDEFNEGFTELWNNRFDTSKVDEYTKNQLIQLKYFTLEINKKDKDKYSYDEKGILCYKKSGKHVYNV